MDELNRKVCGWQVRVSLGAIGRAAKRALCGVRNYAVEGQDLVSITYRTTMSIITL